MPNLHMHVLRTASSALGEIHIELEKLSKHCTQTLYYRIIEWFYYMICTITGLDIVILYTYNCKVFINR